MFFWTVLGMSWKVLRGMEHENQRIESVSRFSCESAKLLGLLVDLIGIEPMTSSMPWSGDIGVLLTVKDSFAAVGRDPIAPLVIIIAKVAVFWEDYDETASNAGGLR